MLSFRAATSPRASTVIERVKSPLVTAVATSAMARTCVAQILGQLIHVVRQGLPGPGRARHAGLASELSFNTDFACHRGHLVSERGQRIDMLLIVSDSSAISPSLQPSIPVKGTAGQPL